MIIHSRIPFPRPSVTYTPAQQAAPAAQDVVVPTPIGHFAPKAGAWFLLSAVLATVGPLPSTDVIVPAPVGLLVPRSGPWFLHTAVKRALGPPVADVVVEVPYVPRTIYAVRHGEFVVSVARASGGGGLIFAPETPTGAFVFPVIRAVRAEPPEARYLFRQLRVILPPVAAPAGGMPRLVGPPFRLAGRGGLAG